MSAEHTPTPWTVVGAADEASVHTIQRGTEVLAIVGEPSPFRPLGGARTREANAAFIVRAVNAHDELLTALGTLVAAVNVKKLDPLVVFAAIEKARAAIARATEVQS